MLFLSFSYLPSKLPKKAHVAMFIRIRKVQCYVVLIDTKNVIVEYFTFRGKLFHAAVQYPQRRINESRLFWWNWLQWRCEGRGRKKPQEPAARGAKGVPKVRFNNVCIV